MRPIPAALLFSLLALGETSSACFAQSLAAPVPSAYLSPGLISSESQTLGNRIYRSVGENGQIVFGDKPEPNAIQATATNFMSYSSPQALARAQQEREYWRNQAEGLRQRQTLRDRELERVRREREDQAAFARAHQDALIDRRRVVVGYRNFPPAVYGPVSAVYASSPGAVNGRSSGFIGSGFTSNR